MDPKTAEALEASIAKWEKNARVRKRENVLLGGENCPLCAAFSECAGCPVAARTGQDQCDYTPYYDAYWAAMWWGSGLGSAADFRKAAKAEVAFLKSLRETS